MVFVSTCLVRNLLSALLTIFAHAFGFIIHLAVAILCRIMARTPDKIKSIDGSRETLKLAVRITDLWFVGTPNKSEQAEMVIVDSDLCFFPFIWLLDC